MKRQRWLAVLMVSAWAAAGCSDDSVSNVDLKDNGESCATDSECASAKCVDGVCSGGGEPDDGRADGKACTENEQCLSGACIDGVCGKKDEGESGNGSIGADCERDEECKSRKCRDNVCIASQLDLGKLGDPCGDHGDCVSKKCHEERCVASICGNGELEQGEACDDGNARDGDGCSADCKTVEDGYTCEDPGYDCVLKSCGNGVIEKEAGEECDDGDYNVDYGYGGCSLSCKPAHYCGDGLLDKVDIDNGEECDNGVDNRPVDSTDRDACSVACKRINYCGDGKVTDGELCDDGNNVDGDGCSAACATESGWVCTIVDKKSVCSRIACGNGIFEPNLGEECDDGNRVSGDGCSANCRKESGWDCSQGEEEGATVCLKTCGNGKIETKFGEACDDGNEVDGDGCSASCKVEAGYYCVVSTGSEQSQCYARLCGDGFAAGSEECDDGNTVDGDGCSSRCRRESGYHCPPGGGACEKDVCGDGTVTGDETCDEGKSEPTGGCKNCKMQSGWECLTPGAPCTNTAVCGDGVLQGIEECDEGANKTPGCHDCVVADGWRCPDGSGKACIQGKCGDGILDKGEACDDGNDAAGDGCSPDCEIESIFECTGVTCRPICGDGLTLTEAGEECDDGNNVAGDGCSPDCKIEKGFTCKAPGPSAVWPDHLDLPITYRDFLRYSDGSNVGTDWRYKTPNLKKAYVTQELYDSLPDSCKGVENGYRTNYPLEVGRPSPDFHSYCPASNCEGAVREDLDVDGKPALNPGESIHKAPNMSEGIQCRKLYTCPEVFKWWYTDVPGLNKRYESTLRLSHQGNGHYAYANNSFLPLKGIKDVEGGVGFTQINGENFGEFTSEFHTYFKYKGGENLTFNGDDDVWVFFNRKLAVDIGGIHPAWEKTITLDANTAKKKFKMYPGGIYPLDMFHAERCLGGSSFKLTLSGFVQMGKATCETVCGDGIVAGSEECDDGNTVDNDGCTNACTRPKCGDGIVQTFLGEVCDDGVNDGTYGHCGFGCSYWAPRCGDGVVDTFNGEECDDGVNDGTYGSCTTDCKFAPRCGDGIVQEEFEQCDEGEDNGKGGCSVRCEHIVN